MTLAIETSLHGIAGTLRAQVAPAVTDSFAGETTRLAALLVTIAANAVDDAAAVRVWENAAIRRLFAGAGALADDDLARRLAEAAISSDPGLRISELDLETVRLRLLLVELHASVETQDNAQAQAIDDQIWQLLGDVEARRAPRS